MVSPSLFLLLLAAPLPAATSQVWETTEYVQFAGGRIENLSLRPGGTLVIAAAIETVYSSDQPLIWSMAAAPDGSLYLGTGHQGNVYRIDPKGSAQLLWSAPEIEVFAIAVAPDGSVFAGTSPDGKVYRINDKGEHEVYFDPKETYIWSLVVGKGGGKSMTPELFIGTGEEGKIYRATGPGEGELYYESGQRHVVSLALDTEGRLLAGTDPNGILYRIEQKGKAFALYDSDLPEIRDLHVTSEGEIFAAAVGGGYSAYGGSSSFGTVAGQAAATATITVTASPGNGPKIEPKPTAKQSTEPQSAVTVSGSMIAVTGLERAAVLRIAPSLEVEKIWKSDSESVLAIGLPGSGREGVLVATDKQGRIYSVDKQGEITLEAQQDHGQITRIVTSKNSRWITTAHTGELLRWGHDSSKTGSYTSSAHDAKTVARWGRLSWRGELPGGVGISFRTRSGNSAQPDTSWSDWSETVEMEEGPWRGGPIASPPARYVQWKVTLTGKSGRSPLLHGVRLTYLPRNRAPKIESIDISTASVSDTSSSADLSTDTSPSDSSAYSITVTDTGSVSSAGGGDANGNGALTAGPQRKLKIAWTATDPDGDDLLAAVSFQGEGESAWKRIKDKLDKKFLTIDSDSLADGTYRFRIEVNDAKANPPDAVRSASRVSEPLLVDHTPPTVRLLDVDDGQVVRFEARDAASMLRGAEYSVDAGMWVPILSDDGIVDSLREAFTIRLAGVDGAEHLVTLRVRDKAGNAGLAKAVVR